MAIDFYFLTEENSSWSKETESLADYLLENSNGKDFGYHEGNRIRLKTGEVFLSVGIPNRHEWLIPVIKEWCNGLKKHSGIIEGETFSSTLGEFDSTSYTVEPH